MVRVTQSRTELPGHVCSLVVGVSNILPKVRVSMLQRSSWGKPRKGSRAWPPVESWGLPGMRKRLQKGSVGFRGGRIIVGGGGNLISFWGPVVLKTSWGSLLFSSP